MPFPNRYRSRRLAGLCLVLVLGLMACDNQEPTPTPTRVAAAATDTPAPPTATPRPTNTPAPTNTPPPTATPAPTDTPAPAYEPEFSEDDCQFDAPPGFTVRCGYLVVPLDRRNLAVGQARLHVAIFSSLSDDPAPDPIVYLEGGPGGDALEAIPLVFEDRFAPFLANRDFIMFDQRGTGYSEPSLACPEFTEFFFDTLDDDLGVAETRRQLLAVLGDCRDRLSSEGVDFSLFNSATSAADLNDLRQALGHESWNLLGISYGTRLALTTMRDYPDGIRSVVLDSTYPLTVNVATETAASYARVFDLLFAGCAGDAVCNSAYPELESEFFTLVAALNEAPVTVTVTNFLTGERYEALVDGNGLIGTVFQGLYSSDVIPSLPKLIFDTRDGDYSLLSLLLSNAVINQDFLSLGVQLAVQCHEEISFSQPGEATATAAQFPEFGDYFDYGLYTSELSLAVCQLWDAGAASLIENEAVFSAIPTLILAGEYDPITPPAWGEMVAGDLANSHYFLFPGLGHGVSVAGDCPVSIVESFLSDPSGPPEAGCLAELGPPAFVVAGEAPPVTMVPFESATFGLRGVRPEGWEEVIEGTYLRMASGLDQTALVQQGALGFAPSFFLELLTRQLGLEEPPTATGTYESAGREWTVYETETSGISVDIATAEEGGFAFIVVLISAPAERDSLYDSVFLAALDGIERR